MDVIEENKTTARRFLDLVGRHDVDSLIDMVTPSWTMHGGPPNLPVGAEGLRALFSTFGWIQQKWTIGDVIAEDDRVVRATNRCEQDAFFGVLARGRWQVFTATFIHRIVDGCITQTWRNAGNLDRLLQLGACIEPGRVDEAR